MGDLPLTPIWNTVGVIELCLGCTLNSTKIHGLIMSQNQPLAIKDKQPIMLLHNQRLGTSDIQAFNLRHVVCIFILSGKFSEIVIMRIEFKSKEVQRHPSSVRTQWHLQAGSTQCFSEVMVKLLLAAGNSDGQCNIPPLDEGISYSQVSAGTSHTVLLRSDGQAVACGQNSDGRCSIPPLDEGLSYSQVSAGGSHTVLLRNDGQAVACGFNSHGQCSIPPLDEGILYVQVSAGELHTVLLRSDGQAVASGQNSDGRCSIPPLDEGISYGEVSAGLSHTLLLRSDGQAVACGPNPSGQCSIPPLEQGLSYSQVSAGGLHTVLLRSDGEAVLCGRTFIGHCSIPSLDEGVSYSQVSAGGWHVVLLRSDGRAVASGRNAHGQCEIPSLRSWRDWLPFGFASPSYRYVGDFHKLFHAWERTVCCKSIFSLRVIGGVIVTCVGLDGLEALRLKTQKSDRTVDVCSRVARELNTDARTLRLVLPDARLLATICKANPFATLSDVISV